MRYMIDDVPAARDFYVNHLGFTLEFDASPAFASVTREGVRLPEAEVAKLKEAGLTFRNEIHKGQGGSQIILDDPSSNPVESIQPSERYQL